VEWRVGKTVTPVERRAVDSTGAAITHGLRAPEALRRQVEKPADVGENKSPPKKRTFGEERSQCGPLFHEISRAAGPPKQTTKNDGLSHHG
jgi:hypothetical protein